MHVLNADRATIRLFQGLDNVLEGGIAFKQGFRGNIAVTQFVQGEAECRQFEQGVLTDRIQPLQGMTPYARWGDMPVLVLAVVLLLGVTRLRRG